MRRLLCLSLALLVTAPLARGQGVDLVQQGVEALEAGSVTDALRLLRQAVEANPDDAEAQYQLGRVLQVPGRNQDTQRARAAVRRAVELEPRNVIYMTAELESLREDSWFIVDMMRASRRISLANQILAIDSTNAFAHEELATVAIQEYYTYRNAIWTGGSGYQPPEAPVEEEDELGVPTLVNPQIGNAAELEESVAPEMAAALTSRQMKSDLSVQTRGDQFDLGAIQALGAGSFSERADKAYDIALFHLQKALASDPRRRALYDDVLRFASLTGDWTLALRPLAEMYVHFPEDPEMWLYLGLANHRIGEWEAADAAFKNALERMTPEERAVFEDLSYILSPREVAEYREDPEGFAARYWNARDPRFLNLFNERRLEHYARLTTANLLYRSSDLNLPGWETERGQVFVRYGVPDEDVIIVGDFGVVLERFEGRNPAYNSPEMFGLANRFNVWNYGDGELRFVFEDPNRNGEFTLYAPPADLFGLGSRARVEDMDYVLRARSSFRTTPERYDFQVPGRHVNLPAQVTAFRGESGRADVYIHYGVPLADGLVSSGADIPATIRTGAFLVADDKSLVAERRKTVYGLLSAQIVQYEDVQLWVATESVTARSGEYDVAVEFETADAAVSGTHRKSITVPDFGASGLVLSDLLLAVQIEEGVAAGPGRLQRGDFAIQPAPWGVYKVGDPIAVYFETYGLGLEQDLTSYEVEARLIPKNRSRGLARLFKSVFGSRERGVSTGFPVQGRTADDRQYVLLDATGQTPGLYTLTLRVKDLITRETAEREVDLLLE